MKSGFVSLVGAGPGDRELISLKGWRRLQEADVVLYDYLVNERLLNACHTDAELIYVGKSSRHHSMQQQNINDLLVEHSQAGKLVVRLKGGDPFVFGRGGEELIELKHSGIPFEIVPGITAAVAAPAYAGVPVTHRNISLGCTFVTGHETPDRDEEGTDWINLANSTQTLMFYMGMKRLDIICDQLTKYGRDPKTPALIIQHGTWGHQQTAQGTLSTIKQLADDAGLTAPAMILIGKVVDLRSTLAWARDRSHFGVRLGYVGIKGRREDVLDELEREGALVLELPLLTEDGRTVQPRFRSEREIRRGDVEFLCFEDLSSWTIFAADELTSTKLATFDPELLKLWQSEGRQATQLASAEDVRSWTLSTRDSNASTSTTEAKASANRSNDTSRNCR